MTILTASGAEKPKEAQVLINPETLVKVEFKHRDASKQQRKVHAAINDLIRARRRRYLAMNIVVAIASLLVVITGIFGGMYIYKWVSYSNRVAAQGECAISYHEEMRPDAYAQAQVHPAKPPRRGHGGEDGRRRQEPGAPSRRPPPPPPNQRPQGNGVNGRFLEKYNVLNDHQEVLQVPQLSGAAYNVMPINVIHDFGARLTALVDVWAGRCFVKPLDPTVVPPSNFIDMIRRINDGSYVPNICLIRKHYRTQQPPLDNAAVSGLGSDIIARSCSSYTTYMLVRIETPSTLPPRTTRRMTLIGAGAEDVDRNVDVESEVEVEEPPVVLGGESDPDNPRFALRPQRAKRDVSDSDAAPSEEVPIDLPLDLPASIVKKARDTESDAANELDAGAEQLDLQGDGDDAVFNVGYGGGESVEVAFIHFDEAEDEAAAAAI